MLKKVFIVSTIVLLVLFVFFGIYSFAFKDNNKQKKEHKKEQKKEAGVESVLSNVVTNITSDPVVSATIGPDKKTIRYYDRVNGDLWTMTLRGSNKEKISTQSYGIPKHVKWAQNGSQAIVNYDVGLNYFYNYVTNTNVKLRDGMDDVMWSSVGGKILYKYFDKNSKERSLNIANSDGTQWKKIADLPYRFTQFTHIPSSILAAFWPRPQASVPSVLSTVSTVSTGQIKDIYSGAYGADYLFSPNGEKILVSSVSEGGKKITLGVMNVDGKDYTDLLIPTIVSKAVWASDSKTVYYALPNDVPQTIVWPDDYVDQKFTSRDTFFKIDITTGKKTRIVELNDIAESLDAMNLLLTPSEESLFFINRKNNLLYRINL